MKVQNTGYIQFEMKFIHFTKQKSFWNFGMCSWWSGPASVGGLEALWSPLCIVGSPRIVAFIVVTRVLNIINVGRLVAGSVKGEDTAANVSQEWQKSNFF